MIVQPYNNGPVIQGDMYDYLQLNIYKETTAPILFRVDFNNTPYFDVSSEYSVPSDVLALPQDMMDEMGITDTGAERYVYILKPGFAFMLSQSNKTSK